MSFSPNFNTEEFDRTFNLFYLSIHPHLASTKAKTKSFFGNDEIEEYQKDDAKVKNIVIYDINKQSQSLLFEKVNETEVITHFLYETKFDRREKELLFNKTSHLIRNNQEIEERDPINLIFICQLDQNTDFRKIWTFDKHGNNQKLICTIDSSYEKIRTIKRNAKHASIQDYNF